MQRIAPFQLDHPRRVAARGGAADHVDHREFALQRIAAGDAQLGVVSLGQALGHRFQFGRSHVLSRRVDQIAHQRRRLGFGQRGGDCLGLPGKQDAGAGRVRLRAVAVEAVLASHPAQQRRARLTVSAAVRAGWQNFGELCHTPARQAVRVCHTADGKPAVAIRHDRVLVAAAGKLLRRERRALLGVQRLEQAGQAVLVDEVDRDGVLALVGLDQGVLVGHAAGT